MSRLQKLAAICLVAAACWNTAYAQAIPFRITLNTGPNHVRNITLQQFIDRLGERTQGQLDIQVFPSGQLFKGPDVPKALAQGAVEMGVPISAYISRSVPNAGLLDLPMFYGRSRDEIYQVMDGPVGQELNAEIEEKLGVVIIGKNLDLGYGTIFTTATPAVSLAALDGLKLRVPGSPAAKVRYSNLGVEAVSISFGDVPLALSQRTIDGLMTTHETVRSAQLWESGLGYSLDTRGAFFQYVPMIGRTTWDKLDAQTQQMIVTIWAETIDDARALAAQRQGEARAAGVAQGIRNTRASDAELQEFRRRLVQQQDEIVAATRMDPDFVGRAAAQLP